MVTRSNECRQERIAQFVSHQISRGELAALEQHLSSCQCCREELEGAVANESDWNTVGSLLSTNDSCPQLQRFSKLKSSTEDPATTSGLEVDRSGLEYYRSMLGPTDDPQMLGRVGGYEIVGLLGSGGMGVVFKAYDNRLNRYVAIKMLAPHVASSAAARQRFSREAQAAAVVAHENVIAIHCVDQFQQTPYLVMPYLAGVSLQQRLVQAGALSLRETLRIGMQVAAGLAAAHAQGLIHRDVKPANIMMENGVDRVVLTDFGIARAVDDVRLTKTDSLIGTPQYMSPEQAADKRLDYRTDLFSLGSVLYETICGRPAFNASTSHGMLRKLTDSQPTPLRQINADVPEWFERFVDRLLAKSPQDRFASAAEVERILRHCLAYVQQPSLVNLPAEVIDPIASRKPLLNRSRVMITLCTAAVLFSGLYFALPPSQLPVVADGDEPLLQSTDNPFGPMPVQLTGTPLPQETDDSQPSENPQDSRYTTAKEAFNVGAAFYNARNYKQARGPFEACIAMSDDPDQKHKAYRALLASYRQIPEFEPFQKAAEYVITHSKQHADRSLTRRSFLSFSFQRGQMDNLIKRYEDRLSENRDDYLAVYLLSEIYSVGDRNPQRAIELLKQLEVLDAAMSSEDEGGSVPDPAQAAKIVREKGKLARQYSQAKEYRNAAELYEQIAPLDPITQAWYLKEAAAAYLKANDESKALELATAADKATPESRNDQLTHFFHRNLGDVFMKLGKANEAIPHYEIAISKTTIEGYVKDTKASLQAAKEASDSE